MTKTVCDICGKDMPPTLPNHNYRDMNFAISSNGRLWDICDDCRQSLNIWIKGRKEDDDGVMHEVIPKSEVKAFVSRIQKIKDDHNEKGAPINYGTICGILIDGYKLLKEN